MASGLLKDYLGVGLASARPVTPVLSTGTAGYWYATDTGVLSVWDGTVWTNVSSGSSGLPVQDEGTPLVTATTMNFAGTGVTVTNSPAGTALVTIPGSSGGAWTLAGSWTFAGMGALATIPFTGLAGANEIMVVGTAVTKSVSAQAILQVSVNNGSTYYTTSGDYIFVPASGTVSNVTGIGMHTATGTAAKSFQAAIQGCNINGIPKPTDVNSGLFAFQFTASTSPINAVRLNGDVATTFNGGAVYCLTR